MKLFFYKTVAPFSFLVRFLAWRKHGRELGLKYRDMTSHVAVQYDDHLIVEGWFPRTRTRPLEKARSGIQLDVDPSDVKVWKEFLAARDFTVYDVKRIFEFLMHPTRIVRGLLGRYTCDELAAATLVHCEIATKEIFSGLIPQCEHFKRFMDPD